MATAAWIAAAVSMALQEQVGAWVQTIAPQAGVFWVSLVGTLGIFGAVFQLYRFTIENLLDVIDGIESRLAGQWWFITEYQTGTAGFDRRYGTATIRITNSADFTFQGTNYREQTSLTPTSVWKSSAVGIEDARISILYFHASAGKPGANGLMVLDLLRGSSGLVLSGTFADAGAEGNTGTIIMFKSKSDYDGAARSAGDPAVPARQDTAGGRLAPEDS